MVSARFDSKKRSALEVVTTSQHSSLTEDGISCHGRNAFRPGAMKTGLSERLRRSTTCEVQSVSAVGKHRPTSIIRRRFAHELDRFTMRIQGLASKAELAELAILESRLTYERSLRAFIAAARAIANRHQVSALAETFDLWRGESTQSASDNGVEPTRLRARVSAAVSAQATHRLPERFVVR